jgi:alcohol dehydrogenase class IV
MAFGSRGVLVCGRSLERSGRLHVILEDNDSADNVLLWTHPGGEPTLEQVELLRNDAREHNPDWVAAIGGGSVMDLAKAAAGLLHAPLPVVAYHDGEVIPPSQTPFLVVPTTAGTGSEATTVSVLTNSATGVKKSIRHSSFMARVVILDAELLDGCPKPVIAASGMDALTQAIESYCSKGATWLTDTFALKAFTLIQGSQEQVYNGDKMKQDDLLLGSYLAGLALSNARLGIVHGLAHPLGARYHVPHGLACAVCLPLALEYNRESIQGKYDKLSALVNEDICDYVNALLRRMELHSPFAGVALQDIDAIIEETIASGSTKANPRDVTREDAAQLLNQLFTSAKV